MIAYGTYKLLLESREGVLDLLLELREQCLRLFEGFTL